MVANVGGVIVAVCDRGPVVRNTEPACALNDMKITFAQFLSRNIKPIALIVVGTCLGYLLGNIAAGFFTSLLVVATITLLFSLE